MPLSVIDPNEPFQPDYQQVVDDLVRYFRAGLGGNLHSLYIYGSVARKVAKPHRSNIDVIVVTHHEFEENRQTLFNSLRWRFQKDFPFVPDISIKAALVKEVASLDSLFSWGFLLKHCAVCIYGDDLSECFGEYEPSWEIAKYWNMDLGESLPVYRQKLARANSPQEQIAAQSVIAKKLLRSAHTLVMYKNGKWLEDPMECGKAFLAYFPEKEKDIQRLGILLKGKPIPKRSAIGLIDDFGPWLVKQYEKTEFRIG
ncbi:nucleotidyltransferase domain-containing protein [Vibrio sp.]|uniref:Nucleotidyltransferase domain-containing protein n=1 Tax=Vibrio viridaestus TaxID=2487322 RepID=A0A3N9THA1_9VIBR|nr:nucleotidyltransferase domain-containing protein [Vibrio viridaestus]MDC0609703.1 nucleotidyltransferase domain-containing protein [Vibrio sp.]RQW63410.1 nucleotidyltransferase domain-containing protein [Vibrio viridaestus]